MSRRKAELFNLSFLDLLTSALGAVIFLFIITPKGGAPASDKQQMAVYLDTVNHKVFGLLPDSLWLKDVGDTLFTVLVDYGEMPEEKTERIIVMNEPPQRASKPEEPVKQPATPKPTTRPEPKPEPVKTTPTPTPSTTKEPEKPTVKESSPYKGSPPSVPCLVSFEISWPSNKDNVDLFVCRGNDCVYGGRKRDKNIGEWDSGKSRNRLFGNDLRTNQEAVRQFDAIIPGEYTLYAQFKESSLNHQRVTINGLIYTKDKNGNEKGEVFNKTLTQTEDRVPIGKVTILPNGSFQFRQEGESSFLKQALKSNTMFKSKSVQVIFSVVLAAGLWLLLIVFGNIFETGSGMHRFIEALGGSFRGYIQAAIYAVFFYSIFDLSEKRKYIKKQYEGFNLGLLPVKDQLVLSPDEVASIKLNTIQVEQAGNRFLIADFIKKACTQYRNDQSIGETLQVFSAQVDNSKEEMDGELEKTRYLLSAIISLGFIGTLIGLSTSIGMAHLAKTAEGMPTITQHLNVAFDTTLVALLIGLVLNFFYHRYLEDLDTFYSRTKAYVIDNLISRIYKAGKQVQAGEAGETVERDAVDPSANAFILGNPGLGFMRGMWFIKFMLPPKT